MKMHEMKAALIRTFDLPAEATCDDIVHAAEDHVTAADSVSREMASVVWGVLGEHAPQDAPKLLRKEHLRLVKLVEDLNDSLNTASRERAEMQTAMNHHKRRNERLEKQVTNLLARAQVLRDVCEGMID